MLNTSYGITNRWRERLARCDWWVGALVCFSIALRWLMVWNGGQFWFPDEVRFWWSGQVVHSLHLGHWKLALEPILELNQHPGFTCLACVPVAIHWMWKYWMGFSYRALPYEETARFAAAVFSLASVSSMLLVREIVRSAGGSRGEARLAMGLMAASAAMLYYVRHVVPYDLAMA